MKIHPLRIVPLTLALTVALAPAQAPDQPPFDLLHGPATANLGTVARIELPTGFIFLDGDATRRLLAASGERPSGNELGFLRPTNAPWSGSLPSMTSAT